MRAQRQVDEDDDDHDWLMTIDDGRLCELHGRYTYKAAHALVEAEMYYLFYAIDSWWVNDELPDGNEVSGYLIALDCLLIAS